MPKLTKNFYEYKTHELVFARKKCEFHEKVNLLAMEAFSDSFLEFIKQIPDPDSRYRLKKMMGIASDCDKNLSKAGKRAKQEGQKKAGKTKIEEPHEGYNENDDLPDQLSCESRKPFPSGYKQLYRKVVLETHPDRLGEEDSEEKRFKSDILIKVNNAVKEGDFGKIVESAVELGIELPETIELDVTFIDKKISEYNNKTEQIKKTVAWEWYHIEEDQQKAAIIERYAEFMLKNFK